MHFSAAFVLAALPYLATAVPVTITSDKIISYTMRAISSGNLKFPTIHNAAITASNGTFYIGAATDAVCPANAIKAHCSDSTVTALSLDPNNGPSMDILAPGTQLVYVSQSGYMQYNAATDDGSVNAVPHDAITGFQVTDVKAGEQANLYVSGLASDLTNTTDADLQANGSIFFACPKPDSEDGVFEIFAPTPEFAGSPPFGPLSDCASIAIAMTPFDGVAPFQVGQAEKYSTPTSTTT